MKDDFIQGVAAALAELHRLHGCEVEPADVLRGMGLDLTDLRKAKVDRYDLGVIKKFMQS